MEAKLGSSELIRPTNTDSHKAWHLLALLLRIGRPSSPLELASRCNLFRSSPDFVEYLCSIPDSPLLFTSDLLVRPSLVAFRAFGNFVSNLNSIPALGPWIGRGGLGPKRIWEEVERTYYRKRKRLTLKCEYFPVAKKSLVFSSIDAMRDDRIVLALPRSSYDACSKVHFQKNDGISCIMNIQPGDTPIIAVDSGNLNEVIVKTSLLPNPSAALWSDGLKNIKDESEKDADISMGREGKCNVYTPDLQHRFCKHETFSCLCNSVTLERTMSFEPHLESSLLIENPVAQIEAQVDERNPLHRIDLNAPYCPEVDMQTIIAPVEAEKVVHACNKDTNVRTGEEGIPEGKNKDIVIGCSSHEVDIESTVLPINPPKMHSLAKSDLCGMDVLCCHDKSLDREKMMIHENQTTLSAAMLSGGEKQLKTVQNDSSGPRPLALGKILEKNKTVDASIEQHQRDKKSISIRQKLKHKCDKNMYTKENQGNSKGKREKSYPIAPNNQLEPKALPNFESFTVEEEEGSGGYGTVYRARRKNDGVTFAIKCPHSNANRHHVHNEVKMLEQFGGKNFVITYEGSFKSGNSDCLVLEHVEHDRPEVLKKDIDVFQLRWYGYCMFRALAGLHKQGIVHRDVKPGNFLFSRKVNKGYLIDFNLAMDLHQKYKTVDKSKVGLGYGVKFDHVPLPNATSLPPSKSRKLLTSKSLEPNGKTGKSSSFLLSPKSLNKKAVDKKKALIDFGSRSTAKSQNADGSGITSAKDVTSTRTPSAERLREPMPSQGRKELISLVQEAMHCPSHEAVSTPALKRKRVAAPPGKMGRKLLYISPMPLHSTGIAVAGASLQINKGDGKHKREGPCVGTKGFRAPEVLLRSPHQGPKVDIWSAGVTLLYLMVGRTPFAGDPEQNIKEIAKLRGSEDLWEVAKLHSRESSFPSDLLDVKFLPSLKLRDWCEHYTKRPDFLEIVPRSLIDLVDKCLTVNPRMRISAEEALRHEFFAPCHEALRKQRLLRQGLSLDSATNHLTLTPKGYHEQLYSTL